MKLVIIHDSQFGNGKLLSETLAQSIGADETIIRHRKEMMPKDVILENPDLLIIGTAVRVFKISRPSRRWLKKLKKEMNHQENFHPHTSCFITHVLSKQRHEKKAAKFMNMIMESGCTKLHPKWFSGKVKDQEGPFEDNVLVDVTKYGKELIKWMK